MDNKIEITICLGSSCFSRGNKTILKTVTDYINEHNLAEKVFFHGARCFGKCDRGPVMQINDKEFTGVTPDNIADILKSNINYR